MNWHIPWYGLETPQTGSTYTRVQASKVNQGAQNVLEEEDEGGGNMQSSSPVRTIASPKMIRGLSITKAMKKD